MAVDFKACQIRYAKRIAKAIENNERIGMYIDYLAPRDNGYFLDAKRLISIRDNLSRLDFKLMNVSRKPKLGNRTFTKGYFSNAQVNLKAVSPLFEKDALVYVILGSYLVPDHMEEFLKEYERRNKFDLRDFYDVDMDKTVAACELESIDTIIEPAWTPVVFRRK